MWLLKSLLDQNSAVINHKLNDDFKSKNFGGTQELHKMDF
jgi:thymidine kinase